MSITPSLKLQSTINEEQQSGYLQLLEQREEENRQEVARLRAEIKSLKLKLFQLKSKFLGRAAKLKCAVKDSKGTIFPLTAF